MSEGLVHLAHGAALPFDHLVVATGARLTPEAIPGLVEGSFDFYSLDGALRLREALRTFGGGRIKIGIAGIPYKCPPAPVEFVFMLEEHLRKRGIRDRSEITLLSPLNRAFTIESASKVVQPIMERRGIELETFFNVESVDPGAGTITSLEGEKVESDLRVIVPPHRGQVRITPEPNGPEESERENGSVRIGSYDPETGLCQQRKQSDSTRICS
jgi:sulfide:quinone oxidoreductase